MAEPMSENKVCDACGADVRKGALFCYHCGGQVVSEVGDIKNIKVETSDINQIQESKFDEILSDRDFGQNKKARKSEVREISAEKPTAKPLEETNLKSAATMRGKIKSIQPKQVEVIWEEYENTPNIWFILAAIFLTILAIVILFLAIRLK